MICAYKRLMKRLKVAGIFPKKHVLDNEILDDYKQAIREEGVQYELVPK